MVFIPLWIINPVQKILRFLLKVPILSLFIEVITAWVPFILRLGRGAFVLDGIKNAPRNKRPLKLYEYENCPFCRKVRETISALDLDVIIYPCPRVTMKQYGVIKDSRFRPTVMKLGGKALFPFLVDENTDTKLYESSDIIKYLNDTYGVPSAKPPLFDRMFGLGEVNNVTSMICTILRPLPRHGMLRSISKLPKKPLELHGFENHGPSRMVREVLTTLEIPYLYHNIAYGSPKRKLFKKDIPYLYDPNTKFEGGDHFGIIIYLNSKYKIRDPPEETFADYSTKGKDDPPKKQSNGDEKDASSSNKENKTDASSASEKDNKDEDGGGDGDGGDGDGGDGGEDGGDGSTDGESNGTNQKDD